MDKISNEQVSQLLTDAAVALRKVASQRDAAQTQLESMQTRQRVEKLASVMHGKGIELDVSADDLADRLEKAAASGKLDTIEQAVEYSGPNMGEKIGHIAEDRHVQGSDFENYLVGGLG